MKTKLNRRGFILSSIFLLGTAITLPFGLSLTSPILFLFGPSPSSTVFLSSLELLLVLSGLVFLSAGAILPSKRRDRHGNLGPLVGYDRGYDNLYTRGPWMERLEDRRRHKRNLKHSTQEAEIMVFMQRGTGRSLNHPLESSHFSSQTLASSYLPRRRFSSSKCSGTRLLINTQKPLFNAPSGRGIPKSPLTVF